MDAFIRRYRMGAGSVGDLMRTVDRRFAEQVSAVDPGERADPVRVPRGIVGYLAVDTGGATVTTVTLFETPELRRQAERGAQEIRASLAAFRVEEIDTLAGEVMIARAAESLLRPIRP
ncbi:MAG TPA: hypothetical protein VF053_11110 [Streptosporangiales bacterium]